MFINSFFDIHTATFLNYYNLWILTGIILASFSVLDLEEDENILGLEMFTDTDNYDSEDEE